MATVRFVFTIDYVAEILDEDVDLLREIISNDDNLTYGNIISVVTGDDESTSALTDDGVDELRQMLSDARRSAETWQEFLDCFVLDEEPRISPGAGPRGCRQIVSWILASTPVSIVHQKSADLGISTRFRKAMNRSSWLRIHCWTLL